MDFTASSGLDPRTPSGRQGNLLGTAASQQLLGSSGPRSAATHSPPHLSTAGEDRGAPSATSTTPGALRTRVCVPTVCWALSQDAGGRRTTPTHSCGRAFPAASYGQRVPWWPVGTGTQCRVQDPRDLPWHATEVGEAGHGESHAIRSLGGSWLVLEATGRC